MRKEELLFQVAIARMTDEFETKFTENESRLKGILEKAINEGSDPEDEMKEIMEAIAMAYTTFNFKIAVVTDNLEEFDFDEMFIKAKKELQEVFEIHMREGSTIERELEDIIGALAMTETDLSILQDELLKREDELDEETKFMLFLTSL